MHHNLNQQTPIPLKPLRLSFPKDITIMDIYKQLNSLCKIQKFSFSVISPSKKKERSSLLHQIDSFINKKHLPRTLIFYVISLFDRCINNKKIEEVLTYPQIAVGCIIIISKFYCIQFHLEKYLEIFEGIHFTQKELVDVEIFLLLKLNHSIIYINPYNYLEIFLLNGILFNTDLHNCSQFNSNVYEIIIDMAKEILLYDYDSNFFSEFQIVSGIVCYIREQISVPKWTNVFNKYYGNYSDLIENGYFYVSKNLSQKFPKEIFSKNNSRNSKHNDNKFIGISNNQKTKRCESTELKNHSDGMPTMMNTEKKKDLIFVKKNIGAFIKSISINKSCDGFKKNKIRNLSMDKPTTEKTNNYYLSIIDKIIQNNEEENPTLNNKFSSLSTNQNYNNISNKDNINNNEVNCKVIKRTLKEDLRISSLKKNNKEYYNKFINCKQIKDFNSKNIEELETREKDTFNEDLSNSSAEQKLLNKNSGNNSNKLSKNPTSCTSKENFCTMSTVEVYKNITQKHNGISSSLPKQKININNNNNNNENKISTKFSSTNGFGLYEMKKILYNYFEPVAQENQLKRTFCFPEKKQKSSSAEKISSSKLHCFNLDFLKKLSQNPNLNAVIFKKGKINSIKKY